VESDLGLVDVFFANAGVAVGTDPLETPDEA
jgi:NADP-dependent 3-hydroxy acid dehydrogenase YdfG